MLEKTPIATKPLFCCVRFLCVIVVVVLLFSPMALIVSAADVYGNEFLNINDYASYSLSGNNTTVYADLKFPSSWTKTFVFWKYVENTFGSPNEAFTGNDLTLTNRSVDYYMSLIIYPFTTSYTVADHTGEQLVNSKFIDLRYLPSDSSFGYSFDVDINNPSTVSEEYLGRLQEHLLYVDKNGIVLLHEVNNVYSPPVTNTESGKIIKWDGIIYTKPVDGAIGVVPFFTMRNVPIDWDTDVTIRYNGLQAHFSMGAVEFDLMQNERLMTTMENVQEQLVEQGEKIDQLPDKIGDKIESIMDQEKEKSKSEGNKFVDQILDKLPDPSQGVLQALGNLTSSVGYTGTDATLQIPAIVLPEIDGLFPETEIWGGTEFSFGDYIQMLPELLLTLVKSLFTIAIVLFCVFEIKGIISYCLTLRERDGG